MCITTFNSKKILVAAPYRTFRKWTTSQDRATFWGAIWPNFDLCFITSWFISCNNHITCRCHLLQKCFKDWKKLIARDGLQVNLRFLSPSDYILIQYSWRWDETFAHLIFWQRSRCIVDVSVSGKQSRVWRHESKFWERGTKTPGGLLMSIYET